MKFFNIFCIFTTIIGLAYCGGSANNELTFYGQKGEEGAKANPSCSQYTTDTLPTYFAALSTHLDNYDDYCGNYAVFMSSDGLNTKAIAKAIVVDSCKNCSSKHLDVSLNIFKKIAPESAGEAEIIWGIYSRNGKKLTGPYYNSVSGTSGKLGMSRDAFIEAFDANAKKLASSSSYYGTFSSSGLHIEPKKTTSTTSKKTIKTTTTTTTTKRIAVVTPANPVNPVNNPVVGISTTINRFPLATTSVNPIATSINPLNPVTTIANVAATPSVAPEAQKEVGQAVNEVNINQNKKNDDNDDGMGATLGIIAIGGGCLGAAGVGLLFMKKKNPSTYENMKQKFPEAFSNVKRGLSRRATSIKRRVTKRDAKQPVVAMV